MTLSKARLTTQHPTRQTLTPKMSYQPCGRRPLCSRNYGPPLVSDFKSPTPSSPNPKTFSGEALEPRHQVACSGDRLRTYPGLDKSVGEREVGGAAFLSGLGRGVLPGIFGLSALWFVFLFSFDLFGLVASRRCSPFRLLVSRRFSLVVSSIYAFGLRGLSASCLLGSFNLCRAGLATSRFSFVSCSYDRSPVHDGCQRCLRVSGWCHAPACLQC